MAHSALNAEEFLVNTESSPLSHLIDQIEAILISPAEFTSSTLQNRLVPLLEEAGRYEEGFERVCRLEKWCSQLDDATQAAYARERILEFMNKVDGWGEWDWNSGEPVVEQKRAKAEEITRRLGELPIERLKTRVQGNSSL